MDGGREGGGDGGGEEGEEGGGGGGERQSPREDTPPAPCSAFCGPRSCSTLPPSLSPQQGASSSSSPGGGDSGKRRRLWGLRGLVKMFRRRVRRRAGESSASPQPPQPTLRARSTSELAVDVQHGGNNGPYNQGLSVSHDSVFTPDTTTDHHHHHHGHHTTPPALAIATRGVNMAELKAALRHRRGDDSGSGDDDPGLPRSPPTSPTTLDVLNHGLKASSRATQSTCSDGSLLSMGSSENDEDSLGAGSHHSSKVSLLEGRHQVVDHEPVAGAVPLSHQAAHHKIAVRPRRTHGVPRSRRATQIGLPDVIEEANSRNLSSQKLLTAAPASTTITTAPAPLPSHTQTDGNVEEEEQKEEVEEAEKKEREEKREEPLFQRLFGSNSSSSNSSSKRAGRQSSRGRSEDSRENSVSPLRRGGDQRASRDGKKRDSSGTRFPGLAVSKPRQDQPHPLPPTGRPREPSRERSNSGVAITPQELTSAPDASCASPSSSLPEATVRTSLSDDHFTSRPVSYPARPAATAVRKAKSFREVAPGHVREPMHPRAPSQADSEEIEEASAKPNQSSRLSASLESIEGGDGAKRQQPQPSPVNKAQAPQELPPASPQRSSTESLATTPLPGVFIRPHPTTRSPLLPQSHQPDSSLTQDPNSGPFSLDSSVGATPNRGRSEVELRKAASVDQVGAGVELAPVHRRSRQQHPPDPKPASEAMMVSVTAKVENIKAERKMEVTIADKKGDLGREDFMISEKRENVKVERRESVKSERMETVQSERRESVKSERQENVKMERRESVKTERRESVRLEKLEGVVGDKRRSSGQLLRSLSQPRGEDTEPKVETQDGGEPESAAQAYRRQLRKEPSLKRAAPPRDSDNTVPEFMRIQLNRVESKGQAIIYDTEQERNYRREETLQSAIPTSASVTQPVSTKEGQETVAEGEKKEQQSIPSPSTSKTPVQVTKKSSFQGPRGLVRDGSVSGMTMEGESEVEAVAAEPQGDRVQLRRPLMAERVTAGAGSGCPTPPPPSSGRDQPELFKVFARRSFKVKDADKEKLELGDAGEEDGQVDGTGDVTEANVTPMKAPVTPQPPVSVLPSPQELMQKPSINTISFNRKSVGNPALSFVPPVAAMDPTTGSPPPAKGVVIVSSTAASTTSTSSEVIPTPASCVTSARASTTVTTSTTGHLQDTPRRPGRTSSPNIFFTSASESSTTTTSTGEVVSRIINRRLSEISSVIDSESPSPAQVRTSQPSPAHNKPSLTSRPSPSLIWPPRTQLEPLKAQEPVEIQQGKVNVAGEKEVEREEVEVVISPLDIGAARRRFMKSVSVPSGGGTVSTYNGNDVGSSGGSTREGQETSSHSSFISVTTTPLPSLASSITTTAISSVGITSSILSRATTATAPAANTPQFTVTVRTQPPPTNTQPPPASTPPPLPSTHPPPTTTLPDPSSVPTQPFTSPSTEQSATEKPSDGAAEDWRVLVRQRREGRLKQSKTTDAEEIIIETTRPAVSRNSKVLEMASNFQKLQVA